MCRTYQRERTECPRRSREGTRPLKERGAHSAKAPTASGTDEDDGSRGPL